MFLQLFIFLFLPFYAIHNLAFPSVLQYLFPDDVKGYMYTVNGSDIYATWVLVGAISSLSVAAVNYFGTKNAALLQTICTFAIAAVGLALMGSSAVNGSAANIDAPSVNGVPGIITIAVMTPFMLMGFDVIPQAAGEMNIPYKKIGKLLVLSVVMAIFWYAMIIFGVSLSMTSVELAVSGMASADAMQKAYMGSAIASNCAMAEERVLRQPCLFMNGVLFCYGQD